MSPAFLLFVLGASTPALAAPFVNASVATTTVTFEDVVTEDSDFDLNDAAVRYNKRCRVDLGAGFEIVTEEIHLAPISAGASLPSALVLRLDAVPASVAVGVDGAAPTLVCDGNCADTISIFDPFHGGFLGGPSGFVNTVAGQTVIAGRPTHVVVQYATGPDPGSLACPEPRFELHRPGVVIDGDTRLPGWRPAVGAFTGDWRVPTERTALPTAYPRFVTWLDAALGGCSPGSCPDEDWHADAAPGFVIDRDAADLAVTAPIAAVATCDDGAQNQDETGVDCGGDLCAPCGLACPGPCDDGNVCNGVETCDPGGFCVPGVPVLEQIALPAQAGSVDSTGSAYVDPMFASAQLSASSPGEYQSWAVIEYDLAALQLGDARGVESALLEFTPGMPYELVTGEHLVFRVAPGDGVVSPSDDAVGTVEGARLSGPHAFDWPSRVDLTSAVQAAADAGWSALSVRVYFETSQPPAWFELPLGGEFDPYSTPKLVLNEGIGDTPDDGVGCTVDTCDPGTRLPVFTPSDDLCQNATRCDGYETCDPVMDCQAGTPVSLHVLAASTGLDGSVYVNGTVDETGTVMPLQDTQAGLIGTTGIVKLHLGDLGLTSPHDVADAALHFVVAQETVVPSGEEGFVVFTLADPAEPFTLSTADRMAGGMDLSRFHGPRTFAADEPLAANVTEYVRTEVGSATIGFRIGIRSGPRPFSTSVYASEDGAAREPVLVVNGSCFP